MGNKSTKPRDYTSPKLAWDDEKKRKKYIDPNAAYVFNFYGEYSDEEFRKANVDDPELERDLKKYVEDNVALAKICKFQSVSDFRYYKGQKFGFAFFDKAYLEPFLTLKIAFSDEKVIRVQRYIYDRDFVISYGDLNIKWKPVSVDLTTNYICDLVKGEEVMSVENDFGISFDDKNDVHDILQRSIPYMLSIDSK